MRILKPNKSPEFSSPGGGKSGDLPFEAKELLVNSTSGIRQKDFFSENFQETSNPVGNSVKGRAPYKEANSKQANSENSSDSGKKEYARLYSKGIKLLSMREHSTQEITTKLSVKCLSLDSVHAVVDDLIKNNYLSDQRFTEVYVRSRCNRGFGPSKIRNELLSKGITSNLIDDYLNINSCVWFDNAKNQYDKKYADDPVKDYNTWAKRARFMQSRGFSMEHIQVTLPPVDHD